MNPLVLILALFQPPVPTGEALFKARCGMCHVESSPTPTKAPMVPDLRQFKPEAIRDALTIGAMTDNAIGLDDADIEAIAQYLTGKPPAQ